MVYLKISLIFLIGIFDGIIFLTIKPSNLYGVLLIHLILYFLIKILAKKLPSSYNGVPNYLALFLPGLGGVIVSALYISLFYFQWEGIVLSDYERYIEYERFLEKESKLNYNKEIVTLSFIDQMRLLDTTRKKDLIVDFSQDYYGEKVNVLQRGLLDKDSEVRHYSAVTLNMLENKFTNAISKLREEFNIYKDHDSLLKLARAYKEYLESGLISDEIFKIINNEYIEVLLKVIEKQKETPKILDQLVKAFIHNGNLFHAEKYNNHLNAKYPDTYEGFVNQMQIAYEKGDYNTLMQIIKDVQNRELKNSEGIKKQISFWKLEEEII